MIFREIIKNWLIPPGYIDILSRIRSVPAKRSYLPENVEYKDTYKQGERCFILATGPSIKEEKLNLLKGEACISVSNFFVHEMFNELHPIFHVFAPLHLPLTAKEYKSWLKEAISHTNSDIKFVACHNDFNIINDGGLNNTNKFLYYITGGDFPINFVKGIPPIQTVVHIAIYLAIYLGFKEIYLLGVDHSWILHYGESRHFYEEHQHKLVQLNYSEWIEEDIGKEFESNAILWQIYRKIRTYAHENDIRIINLTKNSLLDIFPKMNLNEIIKA
jgi:hypothetical protein